MSPLAAAATPIFKKSLALPGNLIIGILGGISKPGFDGKGFEILDVWRTLDGFEMRSVQVDGFDTCSVE